MAAQPIKKTEETRETRDASIRDVQIYEVTKTDTLVGIAVKFDMTPSQILSLNRLSSRAAIYPGAKLNVYKPVEKTQSAENLSSSPPPETPAASANTTQTTFTATPRATRLPLLVSLRQKRDRNYGIEEDSQSPDGKAIPPSFAELSEDLKQTDVYKEQVRFLINENKVLGTLILTPIMIIFEPSLDDPVVLENGVLFCQLSCDMEDIKDCEVVDPPLNHVPKWEQEFWRCLRLTVKKVRSSAKSGNDSGFVSFLVEPPMVEPLHRQLKTLLSQVKLLTSQINRRKNLLQKEANTPDGTAAQTTETEQKDETKTAGNTKIENLPITVNGESTILGDKDFNTIRVSLPPVQQMNDWYLLYSTSKHGISINTFYNKCRDSGPTVLVIEDSNGYVFGAFLTESWKIDKGYYGTGESFLYTLYPTHNVYKWTEKNNYFVCSREDSIAIGGGGGKFGLWIDADFLNGSSSKCPTFDNERLASSDIFECTFLEVWGFQSPD